MKDIATKGPPTTKSDAAQLGALLGFILGAAIGGVISSVLGAPQDIPAILGAGIALAATFAVCGYVIGTK